MSNVNISCDCLPSHRTTNTRIKKEIDFTIMVQKWSIFLRRRCWIDDFFNFVSSFTYKVNDKKYLGKKFLFEYCHIFDDDVDSLDWQILFNPILHSLLSKSVLMKLLPFTKNDVISIWLNIIQYQNIRVCVANIITGIWK